MNVTRSWKVDEGMLLGKGAKGRWELEYYLTSKWSENSLRDYKKPQWMGFSWRCHTKQHLCSAFIFFVHFHVQFSKILSYHHKKSPLDNGAPKKGLGDRWVHLEDSNTWGENDLEWCSKHSGRRDETVCLKTSAYMKLIQFYLYVLYVWPFIHYSKIINNSKTMFACGNSAISIMTFYKGLYDRWWHFCTNAVLSVASTMN